MRTMKKYWLLAALIGAFWAAVLFNARSRAAPLVRIAIQARPAPWYERSIVGMEVGPTGAQYGSDPSDKGFAAHFDGREIVQHCADAHCQYVVLWARDGEYAYYNSKIMPKCPGLGGRDPLREGVDEAKKRDLPLIAYCVIQQGGHFINEHPEFAPRDADGKIIGGRYCYRSGYLEVMKKLASEMLAYGVAGFHFDMPDAGFGRPYGCYCDTCRKAFEKQYGHPMPKKPTWDKAWDDMLEFRYASIANFERELRDHVKSVNPSASVDYNYFGTIPFTWDIGHRPVQHASGGDFNTGETGVWNLSPLGVGLNAEFYRAATPGKPFQVAMQRSVRIYHDQTTRPLNDIRWELDTLLAHGAMVTMVDKTGYDGRLDPVVYERTGKAFEEALAKRDDFGHDPVQDVGIYFSARTRDWVGRDKPDDYFRFIEGAHKALVYEHIPWGILFDEQIDQEPTERTSEQLQSDGSVITRTKRELSALSKFPIVMLPFTAILSDKEVERLKEYVTAGGNLIVTGSTGQFDRLGEPLKESVLAELIGAKVVRHPDSVDNWFRFESAKEKEGSEADQKTARALRGEIPADWSFLVPGPAIVYEPTTATAFGQLLKPARTVLQQQGKEGTLWPQSADSPIGPAILVNHVGKGTVLTFAAPPDFATGTKFAQVEDRKLLANAIRLLHPEPRVRIDAPTTVEAVVTDDPQSRTLRIHLIGYSAPPQMTTIEQEHTPLLRAAMIEDPPMYRMKLTMRDKIEKASALNPTTQLKTTDHTIEATIDDIHEVLIIKY